MKKRLKSAISIFIGAAIFAAAFPALAQQDSYIYDPFEKMNGPYCSDLVNRSNVKIYGKIRTNSLKRLDGTIVSHEATFAIPPGDKWKVCSEGPFYQGKRLELTIVTLMPVFKCYTKLGVPIHLIATPKIGDDGYNWSATCF
jgi:hypothetical protein